MNLLYSDKNKEIINKIEKRLCRIEEKINAEVNKKKEEKEDKFRLDTEWIVQDNGNHKINMCKVLQEFDGENYECADGNNYVELEGFDDTRQYISLSSANATIEQRQISDTEFILVLFKKNFGEIPIMVASVNEDNFLEIFRTMEKIKKKINKIYQRFQTISVIKLDELEKIAKELEDENNN